MILEVQGYIMLINAPILWSPHIMNQEFLSVEAWNALELEGLILWGVRIHDEDVQPLRWVSNIIFTRILRFVAQIMEGFGWRAKFLILIERE